MLGYVKCYESELLVKHHRLYGAVYCGLCHSIRQLHCCALLPFFDYDFVFLALLRMLICGEEMQLEKEKCLLHPFQKHKMRLCHNKTLGYTVYAEMVLTIGKMQDDLADPDSSIWRKGAIFLFLPFLKHSKSRLEKKEPALVDLSCQVSELLLKGREKEREGAGLDEMCTLFADCLSLLFSFGTEGKRKRLLAGIGEKMGRFLYTLDALDDMEKDLKTGAFNPLLENRALPEKESLCQVDRVLSFYIDEMKHILDLVEGEEALFAICENIICRGLPAALSKILKPKNGENNERSL